MKEIVAAFVGFGEVNTPFEILTRECLQARKLVEGLGIKLIATDPVTDDEKYADANRAVAELSAQRFDMLIVCLAGWIPTHAVVKVIDAFREKPMLLWGLCGWMEGGKLVTTAAQAGTTALRITMQAMRYKFKYIYSSVGEAPPLGLIKQFADACRAYVNLRDARVGTMGYRDMLLYGTMFDGMSLRSKIGVEVEPFEMLEIVKAQESIGSGQIDDGVAFVRKNWAFMGGCDDASIKKAVGYAIAISDRVKRRGYDAVSLIDVDGMKRLLGFPPSMVFMLLDAWLGVCTIPENDIIGSVTQLMVRYATGQIGAYAEFYEFFKDGFLIGVPDFIPMEVTKGQPSILPTAFGLLDTSLLNVSKYKDGAITMTRLIQLDGGFKLHLMTGAASQPRPWEECGWNPPTPQLPSLEVKPDCTMEDFTQKVASQHIIIAYGDQTGVLRDLCALLDIEVI